MSAIPVVITGIGVRCAGAEDTTEVWDNVRAGRVAVGPVTGLDLGSSECQVGGQATGAQPDIGDESDRVLHLLFPAVYNALAEAGIELSTFDPTRVGIALGQCQVGVTGNGTVRFMHGSADLVAAKLGVTGPRAAVSTACTTGSMALALAAERIAAGEADLMIAGGVDQLYGSTWQGFASLQALSPDGCAAYSRSAGLVLGEGAGVLILESLPSAQARGVEPIAELVGWGFSADAYHITSPDPTARGAVLAMNRALDRAGLSTEDVGYLCGHGTGTKPNDTMEMKALRVAFGERAPQTPLSSIKPMIGHTLGAAGAIEAAAAVLALRDQVLPPTANFSSEEEPELDFVPNVARAARVSVTMSNNYAFGGSNTSLVFGRPGTGRTQRPEPYREVCITGVGAVSALGIGYPRWREAMLAGECGIGPIGGFDTTDLGVEVAGELPELSPRGVSTPGEWRQLDNLSRLSLTVSRQAWDDAKLRLTADQRNNTALIFATASGPMSAIIKYEESVAAGEPSPVMFPNTVLTAAPGHVGKALRLRGPSTSFVSGGIAAVHAIEYAALLVARGEVDYALVVAADEVTRLHLRTAGEHQNFLARDRAIPYQMHNTGINLSSAGVAFIIEPVDQAHERGARNYGRILGCAVGGDAVTGIHPDPRGGRWAQVLRTALDRASVTPQDVGYVSAAANGAVELDSLETGVLSKVFDREILVGAAKAGMGEVLGAGGAAAVVAGLVALETGVAPPTAGLTDPIGKNRVRHVTGGGVPMTKDVVMASAYSLGANYGAVVIGR